MTKFGSRLPPIGPGVKITCLLQLVKYRHGCTVMLMSNSWSLSLYMWYSKVFDGGIFVTTSCSRDMLC
jgi:hypothetical protein